MKYRVFTNDVGFNGYSAFCEVEASDDEAAKKTAERMLDGQKNFGRRVKAVLVPANLKLSEVFEMSTSQSSGGLKLRKRT